jgi:PleD family two-component response regulator
MYHFAVPFRRMRPSVHDQRSSRPRFARFAALPDSSGGKPPEDKTESNSAAESGTRGKRVLAIEDNLDSLRSLVTLLRFDGHEAEFAISGYSALGVAERFKPERHLTKPYDTNELLAIIASD